MTIRWFIIVGLLLLSCKEEKRPETKKEIFAVGSGRAIDKDTFDSLARPTDKDAVEIYVQKDSVLTLKYTGTDLGYLAQNHYGNKAYRHMLSAYNGFEDRRQIDKKHDSIRIPQLSYLTKDSDFPRLHTIAEEINRALDARNLYLKQGRTLWNLPFDEENRDFRPVPNAQRIELLGASKLMYECVAGLEQHENPPKKAIGQFRQVAEYHEKIAKGEIDENGYVLDLVHQRLAYGLSNCIKWAKQPDK